ncbi:MAG: Zn-ribbon domain-containing OB-fold protein [Xanthobacteraceae bacterium]
MSDASKSEPIRPTINDVNRPFWDACARGELRLQRCRSCGHLRYPAAIVCPECLSAETEWQAVSGRGKVFSFVVFQRAYHPAWEGRVPYNVALIELDEGPILLSNVIDVDNARLTVGLDVRIAFERLDEALSIPVFVPAAS